MVNGLPCGICFSHEIFISHGMHGTHGIYRCAMFLDMMTGEHDFLLTNYHNFFYRPQIAQITLIIFFRFAL